MDKTANRLSMRVRLIHEQYYDTVLSLPEEDTYKFHIIPETPRHKTSDFFCFEKATKGM